LRAEEEEEGLVIQPSTPAGKERAATIMATLAHGESPLQEGMGAVLPLSNRCRMYPLIPPLATSEEVEEEVCNLAASPITSAAAAEEGLQTASRYSKTALAVATMVD
jgi:hypothetical protein